jgi:hypothetical protein
LRGWLWKLNKQQRTRTLLVDCGRYYGKAWLAGWLAGWLSHSLITLQTKENSLHTLLLLLGLVRERLCNLLDLLSKVALLQMRQNGENLVVHLVRFVQFAICNLLEHDRDDAWVVSLKARNICLHQCLEQAVHMASTLMVLLERKVLDKYWPNLHTRTHNVRTYVRCILYETQRFVRSLIVTFNKFVYLIQWHLGGV